MPSLAENFVNYLFLLCGDDSSEQLKKEVLAKVEDGFTNIREEDSFGYRQMNEVLLLCNKNIVTKEFFKFLAEEYASPNPVRNSNQIKFCDFGKRVEKFRKLAMLRFGSFKNAFEYLRDKKDISNEFNGWLRICPDLVNDYRSRPKPFRDIDENIDSNKLYWLGYLSTPPLDKKELDRVRGIGYKNYQTYLSFDFIDVYVATSMRESWEYKDVNRICEEILKSKLLKDDLNITGHFITPFMEILRRIKQNKAVDFRSVKSGLKAFM